MTSVIELLKKTPYFEPLSSSELARIAQEAQVLSFSRGGVLFLEGEPCRGLYIIESGQVRIFKSSPEGREQVLLIAGPGESFNDVPVFDGGPNPASALASQASTIYVIPKEAVLASLNACPSARAILALFASRLRRLTMMVEDLSFRTVSSRLAKLLLDLAVVEGGPSPVKRLTQDEMATMVGSARDVIGRALRHIEKTGAIKIQGQRILVVSRDRLKELT